MKKIFIIFFFIVLLGGLLFDFTPINAQSEAPTGTNSTQDEIMEQLKATGGEKGAGLGIPQDPRLTIANIIRVVLEFLGTLAVVLIIYAGFLWMTAGGNDDQVSKSKKILYQSVIGLVIILTAYSITLMAIKLALGEWTDYEGIYVEDYLPQRCKGLSCP